MVTFKLNLTIFIGTGHEAAFTAWMYCLFRLDLVTKTDFHVFPLCIFPAYLDMIRNVQITYKLEPAV
jgi:serine/threonine-protein phosphatase 2A activator